MDSKLVFPAALLVLLCLIETGSSIDCYQCNSYEDPHCGDPFYFPEDVEKKAKNPDALKPCDPDTDDKKHFCRKIYQNVRGDERVIRSCGTIRDERERNCYTTVLEEYNTEVCQCDLDGCNSGNMFKVSTFAVLSAVVLAYLIH
eukprot:TRINITY_DN242_c0_g1_i3.p1 TRINITY_DN242_c0_g1~~TRINITY_DN242_c0_g1_i3.p1  ORF type:complete len:144 (+),score=15.56 TRINITY_DN242_c0_g1_i3:115-546(+)